MAGIIKGAISTKHLDAISSDLFAILAVNGLDRPVKRSGAVRFFQLGPEPPRNLQWSNVKEYGQLQERLDTAGRRGVWPWAPVESGTASRGEPRPAIDERE